MAEKSTPPFFCFGYGEKKNKLGGGRTSVLGVIHQHKKSFGIAPLSVFSNRSHLREKPRSLERLYAQLCSVYARFICGGNVFCNLL